jgi:hypothetical protein
LYPVDRVVADTLEDVTQITFRIDVVQLGGADQGVDAGRAFAAEVCPSKEMVLAPKGDGSERAFGGVVIELRATIVAKYC